MPALSKLTNKKKEVLDNKAQELHHNKDVRDKKTAQIFGSCHTFVELSGKINEFAMNRYLDTEEMKKRTFEPPSMCYIEDEDIRNQPVEQSPSSSHEVEDLRKLTNEQASSSYDNDDYRKRTIDRPFSRYQFDDDVRKRAIERSLSRYHSDEEVRKRTIERSLSRYHANEEVRKRTIERSLSRYHNNEEVRKRTIERSLSRYRANEEVRKRSVERSMYRYRDNDEVRKRTMEQSMCGYRDIEEWRKQNLMPPWSAYQDNEAEHLNASEQIVQKRDMFDFGEKETAQNRFRQQNVSQDDIYMINPEAPRYEPKPQQLTRTVSDTIDLTAFDYSTNDCNTLRRPKKPRTSQFDYSRSVRNDASLVPPIRQTASIFKQPVTVYKTQEGKVKTDFKHGPQEKPKQLFWEKRLEGLRASDKDGCEVDAMELPKSLRPVGPNVGEETLLQSVATALHVLSQPITGQTASRAALAKDPGIYINPEQPLVQAMNISDEDIRRQEERVQSARRRLQDAVRDLEESTVIT